MNILGYGRVIGRPGIRNYTAVIYVSEGARLVASRIAQDLPDTQVFGIASAHPTDHALRTLVKLGSHANVGASLIVGLGNEKIDPTRLVTEIRDSGRRAESVDIRMAGGTRKAVEIGRGLLVQLDEEKREVDRVEMTPADLVIGVECGGSDATSGITANPACGYAVDRLIDKGGTVLFLEVNELLGCEPYLIDRAVTTTVKGQILQAIGRAREAALAVGHFAFAPGNAEGGLTTIEEKSLGALLKGGSRPIEGVLRSLETPRGRGLYFIDYSQTPGKRMLSFYEENDPEGVNAMIAAGAHLILFTTGRGSVTGSVVGPVIKICGNPETYDRMPGNFDVNAGEVITGEATLEEVGDEIYRRILETASGTQTAPEALGHAEFWIPNKG